MSTLALPRLSRDYLHEVYKLYLKLYPSRGSTIQAGSASLHKCCCLAYRICSKVPSVEVALVDHPITRPVYPSSSLQELVWKRRAVTALYASFLHVALNRWACPLVAASSPFTRHAARCDEVIRRSASFQ